jgi:hypothetical protein
MCGIFVYIIESRLTHGAWVYWCWLIETAVRSLSLSSNLAYYFNMFRIKLGVTINIMRLVTLCYHKARCFHYGGIVKWGVNITLVVRRGMAGIGSKCKLYTIGFNREWIESMIFQHRAEHVNSYSIAMVYKQICHTDKRQKRNIWWLWDRWQLAHLKLYITHWTHFFILLSFFFPWNKKVEVVCLSANNFVISITRSESE